jgi:DNA-binding MarR family transcriptional regulator
MKKQDKKTPAGDLTTDINVGHDGPYQPSEALRLDNQLCFPLYAASRKLIKLYTPILKPLGLTYTQYITLLALWEEDSQSVKSIGSRLQLDSGTLTPLLKKLEQQGLIKRERMAEDERNVLISLTARGNELKNKAQKVPGRIVARVNLNLNEALELKRLLNIMLNEDCSE